METLIKIGRKLFAKKLKGNSQKNEEENIDKNRKKTFCKKQEGNFL